MNSRRYSADARKLLMQKGINSNLAGVTSSADIFFEPGTGGTADVCQHHHGQRTRDSPLGFRNLAGERSLRLLRKYARRAAAQILQSRFLPLVVEGSVSNARADQAAKELGVSRSLVYRLVARYRQRAQTSSLLSVPRGRIERTQWLDKEVETLIGAAVERIYLQREQPGDAVGSPTEAHRLPGQDYSLRARRLAPDDRHQRRPQGRLP
jgi:hypothetical protein